MAPRAAAALLYALRALYAVAPAVLHPDEYGQSVNPVAAMLNPDNATHAALVDAHGRPTAVPWEFRTARAARSCAAPALTAGLGLAVAARTTRIMQWQAPAAAFARFVLPKALMATAVAFTGDSAASAFADALGAQARAPDVWPMAVLGAKPLANAVEALLFAALVAMYARATTARRATSTLACLVGALVAVGCAVRFTFVVFAAPLVLHGACLAGFQRRSIGAFAAHVAACGASAAAVLAVLACVDATCYARFGHAFDALSGSVESERWRGQSRSFLLPWLNNLRYNADGERVAAEHGRHPRLTHALISMPWLSGPAYALFTWRCIRNAASAICMPRATLASLRDPATSLHAALCASVVLPLLALSLSPHQEPRFLLPAAWAVQWSEVNFSSARMGRAFHVVHAAHQIAMPLVYAIAHQGGLVRSQLAVLGIAPSLCVGENATSVCKIDVAYAQTYPPTAPLFTAALHDGIEIRATDCMDDTACFVREQRSAHILVAPPSAMRASGARLRKERLLFPHFSGETTPGEFAASMRELQRGNARAAWRHATDALSLGVYV